MVWRAVIEKTENGYVIEQYDGEIDNKIVIETPELNSKMTETKAEQIAFQKLFFVLREYFAVYNDKHTNQYLDIKVSNTKDE